MQIFSPHPLFPSPHGDGVEKKMEDIEKIILLIIPIGRLGVLRKAPLRAERGWGEAKNNRDNKHFVYTCIKPNKDSIVQECDARPNGHPGGQGTVMNVLQFGSKKLFLFNLFRHKNAPL